MSSSAHSTISGMKSSRKGREEALTQGMKINRKQYLPVIEQGDALSFYVEGRNEPVPPDPAIISNVKYTYVAPPPPKSVAKSANPCTSLVTKAPSMNWFLGPKLDRDILPPSHSLANELYKPVVKVIGDAAAKEEKAGEVRSEVTLSTNVVSDSNPSAACSGIKSISCEEAKSSSLKWLQPTKNDDTEEEEKPEASIMTSSLKVFLEEKNEEQEVRVIKQLSSQEFLVNQCDELSFDKLVSLEKKMFSSLGPDALPAKSVEPNMFYALRPAKSIAKVCYRAKILKVLTDSLAHVFTVDHGNYHIVSTANLFPLKPEWTSLPQQACYIRTNLNYAEEMKKKIIVLRPLHNVSVDVKLRAPPESLNEVITIRGYQVLVTVT